MAQSWRPAAEKVVSLDALQAALAPRRAAGERVALTNGTFDLLHVGHLRSLEQARAQGDLLVVGVNSDASVRSYKAPNRPIVPQAERAELIAGLACVDYVVIFDEPTAERLVKAIRPEVYVKGADYATKPLPERPVVEAYGGQVVLIPLEAGHSTTDLVGRGRPTLRPRRRRTAPIDRRSCRVPRRPRQLLDDRDGRCRRPAPGRCQGCAVAAGLVVERRDRRTPGSAGAPGSASMTAASSSTRSARLLGGRRDDQQVRPVVAQRLGQAVRR